MSVDLHREDVAAASQDPDVLWISGNPVVFSDARPAAPVLPLNQLDTAMLRQTLGLPSSGLSGAGVIIAVIDSGIAATSDLKGRVLAQFDFTAGGKLTRLSDSYGHGTHIAGTIAGSGAQSQGK